MTRQPWFRMYVEARTDRKLDLLSDASFRVWFNLLCYAADNDDPDRGYFDASDPDVLSIEVSKGDSALLIETIQQLLRLRIIEVSEGETYFFTAFRRRQYDKPSDAPQSTAERKRRQREREKEAKATEETGAVPSSNGAHRVTRNGVTPASRPVTRRGEERREEESRLEETSSSPTPASESVPPGTRDRRVGSSTFPVTTTVLQEAEGMDADALLNWFRTQFPDQEAWLSEKLAAAKGTVRSEAAYLRPAILKRLAGKEARPVQAAAPRPSAASADSSMLLDDETIRLQKRYLDGIPPEQWPDLERRARESYKPIKISYETACQAMRKIWRKEQQPTNGTKARENSDNGVVGREGATYAASS